MIKFSSYQDTNTPWIGEIPTGWSLKSLKHIFTEKKSTKNPDLGCGSISFGKVIYKDDEKIPESTKESYQEVLDGEFLINPLNLNYDLRSLRIGLSRVNVVVSQGYIVLNIRDGFIPEYYEYLLRKFDVEHMKSLGQGVRQTISYTHLKDEKLVVPPVEEQLRISRYLDKKTIQIDSLIDKIEKKIELLKEQRTSLINQCVTKGLNPNVEMKDSGVEWIGVIPKHWSVIKLKYFYEIKTGRDPSSIYLEEGQFDVLGTGGVIGKTNTPMYEHTSLILGRKGTIDKPFIQTSPFWISDVVYYTIPKGFIDPKYLWFLFTQIDFSYYKYGSTLPSMSSEEYENMKFPLPPENEVRSIQTRLNEIDSRINSLISSLEKKKSLLKEYRQSLISSAVTGKVRVTEEMI